MPNHKFKLSQICKTAKKEQFSASCYSKKFKISKNAKLSSNRTPKPLWKCRFLPRDAMQARPMSSCGVCLSVRLSRSSYFLSKRIKISSNCFHLYTSFSIPNVVAIFRRELHSTAFDAPMGASNAGGVGRNRDSEPISGFLACCQRCDRLGVINRVKLWHLSLVVSGQVCWWRKSTTKCLWQEVSINVTPKTTEQHLIVCSSLTCTDRHEASRGLFATAELLVSWLISWHLATPRTWDFMRPSDQITITYFIWQQSNRQKI